MADDHGRPNAGDPQGPFLFVPRGDPPPLDWMARHPGWVKFPATMVPHRPATQAEPGVKAPVRETLHPAVAPIMAASTLAMTASNAAAIPGVLPGIAAGTADAAGALGIAGLATLGAGAIVLFRPGSTQSQDADDAVRRPRQPGTGTSEEFVPPSPLPHDPGVVPPPLAPERPADAGLPPAPPVPGLPGLSHADPLPHLLSTPASDHDGPTIFQQDRNKGLDGGAKTHSSRARKNARIADPDVTAALKNDEWEAHHLVTVAAARENPALLEAAVRGGWRMDGSSNMIALPASPTAQEKLAHAGLLRPVHDSGHPVSASEADAALKAVPQELKDDGLVEGTPVYDKAARRAFEDISDRLRREMHRLGRVSENEQARPEQDA